MQPEDAHIPRSLRLALGTGPRLDLLLIVLEEGTQDVPTLDAVVLDHLQLREDAGSAGHHSLEAHQAVQVELPAGTVKIL